MANGDVSSVSRLGQINAAGGSYANDNSLFLKVFANEVLTTFEEFNVMKSLHTVRTISSGKSAQFPVTGIATAKYHTVGEDILESSSGYTSQIKHAEKIINIDDVLLASTFIANIDEMKNHYDVRSIYAKELGKALAKRFDIATMKTLAAAAGQGATISGTGKAGISITAADGDDAGTVAFDTAGDIIGTITTMAQKLDENDVPSDGRFIILKPESYYKLLGSNSQAINKDFTTNNGDLNSGRVAEIAGISIYKSNHLNDIAVADASQDQDDDNARNEVHASGGDGYNANLSTLKALGGHTSAIGTVKLMDLTTESEYIMTKQGTALVAKYAMGHGVLRPECAVKIV